MKSKASAIYNMINKYKNNNLLFMLIFSIVLLSGFKIIYFDFLATILLLVLVIFLKPEEILYSYIFLFFFEPVTEISILGGSINRVVMLVGIAKVLYYTYKEKIKIKKESMLLTLFFSFFLIFSVMLNRDNIIDNVVLYINIMFFIIYSNYLSSYNHDEKRNIVNGLLQSIVCGVFFSIIHGLLSWNFEFEKRVGFSDWRFNGTNDPNFLAYYINLAVVAQIFKKKSKRILDKRITIIINVFLLVGLLLSKSITGIFINAVSFIILMLIKHKKPIVKYIQERKKKVAIVCSLVLIILGIGAFIVVKQNINAVYQNESGEIVAKNRIADILLSIKKGDIDRLTSQKTRDWRLFLEDYKNNDIIMKMFGKGMNTFLLYSSYWQKEVSSHSTYIDFLCCYGIVGMIIIIVYINRKLKGNLILSSRINNRIYRYIRVILLIYALELSIYTNRVFLLMFLL